jgi:hypothetical protein
MCKVTKPLLTLTIKADKNCEYTIVLPYVKTKERQRVLVMRRLQTVLFALAAFGLGWAVSWVVMPLLLPARGTEGEISSTLIALASFLALLSAFLVGLVFSGRRINLLLPVGCVFLLGNGMGTFRMLPRPKGGAVPILPVSEAFGQILPRLLDQWPLKLAFILCAAALCVTYLMMRRRLEGERPERKIALFLCIILAIGLCTFFVRDAIGTETYKKVKDAETTGFYRVAKGIPDAKIFLRLYERRRDYFHQWYTLHVWSNMPGKTLLYYLFFWMGLGHAEVNAINLVLCALTVLPLFFVVRRLVSTNAAAGAAVLFFLFPGVSGAFPAFNAMTAFFAMLGLWLVLACLEKGDPAIGVLTGLYLALLYFYEPLPFVLALFLVPYIWRTFRARAVEAVGSFSGIVTGFVLVFIALYLWSGVSIFKITSDTIDCGMRFNEEAHREYTPYVFGNLVEMCGTVGWAVFMLWVFGAVQSARGLFRRGEAPLGRLFREVPARAAVCVFTFSLMLMVLDLSGENRGEVSRLWIFLMPLMGACAMWAAETLRLKNYMPILCALLCAEGILMHAKTLLWPL